MNGAEAQSRTGDTSIFSAVLYQLSYLGTAPHRGHNPNKTRTKTAASEKTCTRDRALVLFASTRKRPTKIALVLAIGIWYFSSSTWSDTPGRRRGTPSPAGRSPPSAAAILVTRGAVCRLCPPRQRRDRRAGPDGHPARAPRLFRRRARPRSAQARQRGPAGSGPPAARRPGHDRVG